MQPISRPPRSHSILPSPRKGVTGLTKRIHPPEAPSVTLERIQCAKTSEKRRKLIKIFYARVHSSEDLILKTFNDLNLDARVDFYQALEKKREFLFRSLKPTDALRLFVKLDLLEQVYLFRHCYISGMGPIIEKAFFDLDARSAEDRLSSFVDVPFFDQLTLLKAFSFRTQFVLQHLVPNFWMFFSLYATVRPQAALQILVSHPPIAEKQFHILPKRVQILYLNHFPELTYALSEVLNVDWLLATREVAIRGNFPDATAWKQRIANTSTSEQKALVEEYLYSDGFVPLVLIDLSDVKDSRKAKFVKHLGKQIRNVPKEIVGRILECTVNEIPQYAFGFSWFTTADRLLKEIEIKLKETFTSKKEKAQLYLFLEYYLKTKIDEDSKPRVVRILERIQKLGNIKFCRAWTVWNSINEMRSQSSSPEPEEELADFEKANAEDVAADLMRNAKILINEVVIGEFTKKTPDGGMTFKRLVSNWNDLVHKVKLSILSDEIKYEFFLKIARKLVNEGDFYSSYAIYAALQSAEVSRLGVKCVDLDQLFDPDLNFKNLRRQMSGLKSCIPMVPLLTKDLSAARENMDVLHGEINPEKIKILGKFFYEFYTFQVVSGTNQRRMRTTITNSLMEMTPRDRTMDLWRLSLSQKPRKKKN